MNTNKNNETKRHCYFCKKRMSYKQIHNKNSKFYLCKDCRFKFINVLRTLIR